MPNLSTFIFLILIGVTNSVTFYLSKQLIDRVYEDVDMKLGKFHETLPNHVHQSVKESLPKLMDTFPKLQDARALNDQIQQLGIKLTLTQSSELKAITDRAQRIDVDCKKITQEVNDKLTTMTTDYRNLQTEIKTQQLQIKSIQNQLFTLERNIQNLTLLMNITITKLSSISSSQNSGAGNMITTSPPPTHKTCTLLEFTQGTFNPEKNEYVSKCPIPSISTPARDCVVGRKVMIIGDSNAYHLFNAFISGIPDAIIPHVSLHKDAAFQNCVNVKSGSKCGEESTYFEFEPSDTLKPTCKFCNGCVSRFATCDGNSKLEYLSIEFIEDNIMPSKKFNTTQENIIEYMTRDPPDLILLNSGVHIMQQFGIEEQRPKYKKRLVWYFQEIRKQMPNTRLVWVQSPKMYWNPWGDVFQEWLYQTNLKVAQQNAIPVLDAYNFSTPLFHLRSDDVHYLGGSGEYYNTLRNFALT
jgi:hypothetical protein